MYHPNGPTVLEIHERYVADFNPFGDSDKNPATLATLKQKFKLESSSLVKRLVISGDFRKEKRIAVKIGKAKIYAKKRYSCLIHYLYL